MSLFRRLTIASTASTIVLIAIGGLVRATKSGLGCGTDWPDCGGRLVPALETRAEVFEFSHRLAASVVVILLGTLTVVAWRRYRHAPWLFWPSVAAFGLVLGQAILGMIVVKLELEAVSVVLHLATALILFAVLLYLSIAAYVADKGMPSPPDRSAGTRASLAAASVLVVLLAGSYVTGREAGYVFSDWPLMDGRLVPDLGIALYAIHFFHRALAAVAGVVLVVTLLPLARGSARRLPVLLARFALLAFGIEVLIGAGNVWTELNAALVTTHLVIGASLWGALVGVAVVSHPQLERIVTVRRVTGVTPVEARS